MINGIYGKTINKIITGKGITKRFRTRKRVRQRFPLSVMFFIAYVENIEEINKKEYRKSSDRKD